MTMTWQMGEVVELSQSTNEVQIRDIYNKVVLMLPLNNIPQFQYMPMIGDIILYINYDDKVYEVVKIWNIKSNNFIRQDNFPLQAGELQLMGVLGQYIHLNKAGTIRFVDSTMLNLFELSVQGLVAQSKQFNLTTYDGINITIDKNINISRTKSGDDNPTFTAMIDDNGVDIKNKNVEIIIDNNNTVTIKGDKIQLGGNSILGDVISSGPFGTQSFCFITGQPLVGSSTCKCTK